jgi:hypothetical protein
VHIILILLDGGVVSHEHDGEQDEGQEDGHPSALHELDQRRREVEHLHGGEEEEEVEGQLGGVVTAQHVNSNIFLSLLVNIAALMVIHAKKTYQSGNNL